jgi:hypothetical protein
MNKPTERRARGGPPALGRVGAARGSVYVRLFECDAADGTGLGYDFETAKFRCGVQACLQPDRTQNDTKLLETIQ